MEVFITPEKECTGVTLKDLEVNLNRFSLAKDGAIQARIGLQHQWNKTHQIRLSSWICNETRKTSHLVNTREIAPDTENERTED